MIGYATSKKGKEVERSVGTGVVIVDKGIILTNLHVVRGVDRIGVTFADGTESDASITGAQPENDLPCCRRTSCPTTYRPRRCAPRTTCAWARAWW